MKKSEEQRLHRNWKYAKKLWVEKKKKYNLNGWGMRRLHAVDKAGLCCYEKQKIYLSTYLLRGHNCTYEKVEKVLLHEIAHALKPGHGHNSQWKKKCREIGGDSRLGVTMVPHGMNWSMSCLKCKWRQEYKVKPKIDGLICAKCKSLVKISFIK
jgi:hypothetical protein